jgi:acyl-CoA dehydrogenase
MEKLKRRAKELGLWNLFLPKEYPEGAGACGAACAAASALGGATDRPGPGLTNLEYAHMSEAMGRCFLASEVCGAGHPSWAPSPTRVLTVVLLPCRRATARRPTRATWKC